MTRRWPSVIVTMLCCLLAVATSSIAQDVVVNSFKDTSCGKWASLRARSDNLAFWARGFISGYNWFNVTNQVTRDLSNETIHAYIDKFCRDNPLKHITTAVFSLICETHEGMAKPFDFCDTPDPRGPKGK
jgi:hypothetical protein